MRNTIPKTYRIPSEFLFFSRRESCKGSLALSSKIPKNVFMQNVKMLLRKMKEEHCEVTVFEEQVLVDKVRLKDFSLCEVLRSAYSEVYLSQ